jgi:hypothetical protein
MSKSIHVCLSVRGMLDQSDRELSKDLSTLTRPGGELFESVGMLSL